MFTAMQKSDSTLLRSVFYKNVIIHCLSHGTTKMQTIKLSELLKAIVNPHTNTWDKILLTRISYFMIT